jgi:hypothetical protein
VVLVDGRADEAVLRDLIDVAQAFELRRKLVDVRLRGDAVLTRRLLVLGRVLVGAGQEEDVIAALAVEAGKRVRTRPLVRMAQVGCAVDVVDSCREVEL